MVKTKISNKNYTSPFQRSVNRFSALTPDDDDDRSESKQLLAIDKELLELTKHFRDLQIEAF